MTSKEKYKKILEVKEIIRELCEEYDLFPYDLFYDTTEYLKECAAWVDDNIISEEERKEIEEEEQNAPYPFEERTDTNGK